jgi:hypothetical protein
MFGRILLSFILIIFSTQYIMAQDTVRVKVLGKNAVTVVDGMGKTNVKVGDNSVNVDAFDNDTVKIRLGRRTIVFVDGWSGSYVDFDTLDDDEFEKWTGHRPKFKGHWAFFEMGVNSFANVSYAGFPDENWMDLNHNKSYEVNFNFLQYSIGLQKKRNTIGLVTGLGLNWNDYRFSNKNTVVNDNGTTTPEYLTNDNLKKTKLNTLYLQAPLMLEFQIPVNKSRKRIYFSGGVIGGLRLGSHTKVKYGGTKDKNRDDFNISPFRYGTTARIGYKGINLYATYYFTPFYESGRGPEMYPFTIGLGLINW